MLASLSSQHPPAAPQPSFRLPPSQGEWGTHQRTHLRQLSNICRMRGEGGAGVAGLALRQCCSRDRPPERACKRHRTITNGSVRSCASVRSSMNVVTVGGGGEDGCGCGASGGSCSPLLVLIIKAFEHIDLGAATCVPFGSNAAPAAPPECVCVCVCVCERERDGVCVCGCWGGGHV